MPGFLSEELARECFSVGYWRRVLKSNNLCRVQMKEILTKVFCESKEFQKYIRLIVEKDILTATKVSYPAVLCLMTKLLRGNIQFNV